MKTNRYACLLGGLFATQAAGAQDVAGLSCSDGELTLTAGPAFSASCAGDLRFAAGSVIEADESITLISSGSLWHAGTLVAPRITLTAGLDAYVFGGLFSGSPDYFPEVAASSFAGSPSASLRTFSDLVPRPVIDPVYGAYTVTRDEYTPLVVDFVTDIWVVYYIPEVSNTPVPEPSRLALIAAGLGLLAWKRRSVISMSQSAQT